ncbi:hypothetical protein HDU67_004559, partial [Dinochytrium kinnereticum]
MDRSFSVMTMIIPVDDAFTTENLTSDDLFENFNLFPSIYINPVRSQDMRLFFNTSTSEVDAILKVDVAGPGLTFSSGGITANVLDSIP